MTKLVYSIRCSDVAQYDRIAELMKGNYELTRKISAAALGHEVAVRDADLVESALILERENLAKTLITMEGRAG